MNSQQYTIQYNPQGYGYKAPRGAFQMTIDATPEQVSGMMLMAGALVGDNLVLVRSSDGKRITFNDMATDPHLVARTKAPDLPMTYEEFITGHNPEVTDSAETWPELISSFLFEKYPFGDEDNVADYDIDVTMKYSTLLVDQSEDYYDLVQFNDAQFLQGAIAMATWLGYNWKDHVKYVHQGTNPIDFGVNF